MSGILGKKIGMTSLFDENGEAIPCTVIEAGPCFVTQVKTRDRDGYNAVQLGFDEKRERLVTKSLKEHFAKAGVKAVHLLREFTEFDADTLKQGDQVNVSIFAQGDVVAVRSVARHDPSLRSVGTMLVDPYRGGPRSLELHAVVRAQTSCRRRRARTSAGAGPT